MSRDFIALLEERNHLLIEAPSTISGKELIKREFKGYYDGLIYRMWDYAKMSGIREKANFYSITNKINVSDLRNW